jgi:hypothetical protein
MIAAIAWQATIVGTFRGKRLDGRTFGRGTIPLSLPAPRFIDCGQVSNHRSTSADIVNIQGTVTIFDARWRV